MKLTENSKDVQELIQRAVCLIASDCSSQLKAMASNGSPAEDILELLEDVELTVKQLVSVEDRIDDLYREKPGVEEISYDY